MHQLYINLMKSHFFLVKSPISSGFHRPFGVLSSSLRAAIRRDSARNPPGRPASGAAAEPLGPPESPASPHNDRAEMSRIFSMAILSGEIWKLRVFCRI